MSNGAFNSTTVGVNNVQSLPLAPAPIVPQGSIKSTSFQSILTLKEIHTDIITVLIQVCIYLYIFFQKCKSAV